MSHSDFNSDYDRALVRAREGELLHLRWCAKQARIVDRYYWEARKKFGSLNGYVDMIKSDRFRFRFMLQERLRQKAEKRRNLHTWGIT